MGVANRLKHAYNAFLNRNNSSAYEEWAGGNAEFGSGSSVNPIRSRYGFVGERSIVASVYTRFAVDAASVDIRHVRLDPQKRYSGDVDSGLHHCLSTSANIDQTGRALLQDLIYTCVEGGHSVLVPVETSSNPSAGGLFDVQDMRVGRVVQWFPRKVIVDVYNDRTGRHEHIPLDKDRVAIIENPFMTVMNEPNSTLQRLVRKLALLDSADEKTASGKLDMFIQLPYPVRSEARKKDAQLRKAEIEGQMRDSTYGIAFIDATEKVTQLNRPAENNLLAQVDKLLELFYSQLGLTPGVMNGTASEAEMLNYHTRTIEPILSAVADEIRRKFLTKTARSQGHDILLFRDPFKLVPMKDLAELADKFTRNEIVTANEFRGIIGFRPADDPKADMLINSNLTVPQTQLSPGEPPAEQSESSEDLDSEEEAIDSINGTLDEIAQQYGVEL